MQWKLKPLGQIPFPKMIGYIAEDIIPQIGKTRLKAASVGNTIINVYSAISSG